MDFGYMMGIVSREAPGETNMEKPHFNKGNVSRIPSIFDYMNSKKKGKLGKNSMVDYLDMNGIGNTGMVKTENFRDFKNKLEIIFESRIDDYKKRIDSINGSHDPYGEIESNNIDSDGHYYNGNRKDELIDKIHNHIPGGNFSHLDWAVKRYNAGDYKPKRSSGCQLNKRGFI